MYNDYSYKISFAVAIALHVAIAILLCIKLATIEKQPVAQSSINIIKAFSVSQSAVDKTIADIASAKQLQQQLTQTQISPPTQTHQPEQPKPTEKAIPKKQPQNTQTLDTLLKQQILTDPTKEAQTLKKELQLKNKELESLQKTKEQQLLHNALTDELSKENKQIQKANKQLSVTSAKTGSTTNTTNSENNSQTQGEVDKYKALIIQAISQEWIVPDDVDKNTSCKLLINLGPGGVVLRVQVLQPSNNPLLDRSAQNAVWKASPLPVPKDINLLDNFRSIQLTVRPEEIVSQ